MTPDQIKEAAIEAAAIEVYARWRHSDGFVPWVQGGNSRMQENARYIALVAIDAYEAAMNRHFDDAPRDGSIVLAKHFHFGWIEVRYADRGVWITRDGREITRVEHLTYFRPLPQPPEVKHETA